MVTVICLIVGLFSLESETEQIAFDFFIQDIFAKEYPTEKNLYFSGCTEKRNSLSAAFPKCFQSDKELVDFFYKTKSTEAEELKIKTDIQIDIKFLRRPKAKTLQIAVHRSFEFAGNDYVYISVYKAREFVDHYVIKLRDQKVLDHCRVSEVI